MKKESRKYLSLLGLLLMGLVALTSCTDDNDDEREKPSPIPESPLDDNDKIKREPKTVTVNRGGTDQGTVELWFYEDMPNVPYISIAAFQELMLPGTTIKVEPTSAGEFTLTGSTAKATVSTTAETFTSDDYMSFTNLMGLLRPGTANVYLDGAPYIRYNGMNLTPPSASVSFDFKKYGIDLRTDGGTVFFPLLTLSSMYSDLYYHYAAYNGEKVQVVTDNDHAEVSAFDLTRTKAIMESTTRPADVAAFGYKQLCFNVDHFYGMPGRSPLESGIKANGLDKTLDGLSTGAEAKKLLTSTTMSDYFLGMAYLQTLLNDGGHTVLYIDLNPLRALDPDNGVLTWLKSLQKGAAANPTVGKDVIGSIMALTSDKADPLSILRNEVLEGEGSYRTSGNTAYCLYDQFGPTNWQAWNAYYSGGCQGATPGIDENFPGDLAVVLEALKAAAADESVKNFVVDLTCNHGGSLDVVLAMTQLMAGQSHFYSENVLTGQRQVIYYDVDANFDGQFDAKDKEVKFDLRYAVLTSSVSFSCGNLFPSLMKDAGIPTFGEKSGGGACAIQMFATPEGLHYQMSSSRARLTNNQWVNIDGGITPSVPVDIGPEINVYNKSGELIKVGDYQNFWRIGSLIDNYYK